MFGIKVFGVNDVGEVGDVGIVLFDDVEGKDGEVLVDDVVMDGFVFVFIGVVGVVVGVVVGEEEMDMEGLYNILFYGEILFVVFVGDVEDVVFEFVVDGVIGDFLVYLFVNMLVFVFRLWFVVVVY